MPLQRLRYVRAGPLVGVRGVGGEPGSFCRHFCRRQVPFLVLTSAISCGNGQLCISEVSYNTVAAGP